jgi:hypothetical protein
MVIVFRFVVSDSEAITLRVGDGDSCNGILPMVLTPRCDECSSHDDSLLRAPVLERPYGALQLDKTQTVSLCRLRSNTLERSRDFGIRRPREFFSPGNPRKPQSYRGVGYERCTGYAQYRSLNIRWFPKNQMSHWSLSSFAGSGFEV